MCSLNSLFELFPIFFFVTKARISCFLCKFAHANQCISIMSDIDDIIAGGGMVFKRGGGPKEDDGKVKTKAKKKKYITGAHGSGSARQKAKYREQRANRHK